MNIDSILKSRTTVHRYTCENVPENLITAALACAVAAPNHKMTEPWRFAVVGTQAREDLVAIKLELAARTSQGRERLQAKIEDKMLSSSHLLVVSLVKCDDPFRAREDYAACACAIQNFCVSLAAHGVGTKWSSGAITTDPRTYKRLQVPDNEEIIGFVWAGWPRDDHRKPPRKLSVERVLRHVD